MKRNKVALNNRRKGALGRLQEQIKKGVKTHILSSVGYEDMPLTKDDISRIKKEINTLTSKITHNENK